MLEDAYLLLVDRLTRTLLMFAVLFVVVTLLLRSSVTQEEISAVMSMVSSLNKNVL